MRTSDEEHSKNRSQSESYEECSDPGSHAKYSYNLCESTDVLTSS
jgi:hypothetical protein